MLQGAEGKNNNLMLDILRIVKRNDLEVDNARVRAPSMLIDGFDAPATGVWSILPRFLIRVARFFNPF